MSTMKTLTIGGITYEIVDEQARNDIANISLIPGTSVTITNITESEESSGLNVITFSDGNTVTIRNGADGHTPIKGVDYWTATDKAEIIEEVLASLGGSD